MDEPKLYQKIPRAWGISFILVGVGFLLLVLSRGIGEGAASFGALIVAAFVPAIILGKNVWRKKGAYGWFSCADFFGSPDRRMSRFEILGWAGSMFVAGLMIFSSLIVATDHSKGSIATHEGKATNEWKIQLLNADPLVRRSASYAIYRIASDDSEVDKHNEFAVLADQLANETDWPVRLFTASLIIHLGIELGYIDFAMGSFDQSVGNYAQSIDAALALLFEASRQGHSQLAYDELQPVLGLQEKELFYLVNGQMLESSRKGDDLRAVGALSLLNTWSNQNPDIKFVGMSYYDYLLGCAENPDNGLSAEMRSIMKETGLDLKLKELRR